MKHLPISAAFKSLQFYIIIIISCTNRESISISTMAFLSKKFLEVPEDKKIKTDCFLDCCDEIVRFFDILGATVFKPVKTDVAGNVGKIRKRFLEKPDKFATLTDIVETELTETDKSLKVKGQGIATNALMWLRRGLKFISLFFQHLVNEDYVAKDCDRNNLKNCALMAYEGSLKKYHGWIVGNIFSLAMRAAPGREKLLQDVAGRTDNEKDEETLCTIKEFSVTFDQTIRTLEELYQEKQVESDYVA